MSPSRQTTFRVFACCCLALASLFLYIPGSLKAESIGMDLETVETDSLIVRFEKPLASAAAALTRSYPAVRTELENALRRKVTFRPVVLLIKDGETFRRINGNDMVVAFAVPHQSLVVIDYSRMGVRSFTLRETLKHELCHLLLHARVRSTLPKWFDEGLAQWVTDGLANIMFDQKEAQLNEAVLFHRLLALDSLTEKFPGDRELLILAYEESKSVTDYIGKSFGKGKILQVLDIMEQGGSFEGAIREALSIPLSRLEENWRSDLGKRSSWYLLLANNLYEILFTLMAVITIYAFFVITFKRWHRARRETGSDEEEE
jgi:hypothetical protein